MYSSHAQPTEMTGILTILKVCGLAKYVCDSVLQYLGLSPVENRNVELVRHQTDAHTNSVYDTCLNILG